MYTDKFNQSIPWILQHEGGFVNDPTDPGGATNFGVSLRFLLAEGNLQIGDINHDGKIDWQDISAMTSADAIKIYWTDWWQRYSYEKISDVWLARKVFDLSVNMGGNQAHKLLQGAINLTGSPSPIVTIVEDGGLGPRSFAAVDALTTAGSADAILSCLRARAQGFYSELIARKPQFEKYRNGWFRRAAL